VRPIIGVVTVAALASLLLRSDGEQPRRPLSTDTLASAPPASRTIVDSAPAERPSVADSSETAPAADDSPARRDADSAVQEAGPRVSEAGIWIGRDELRRRPTEGEEWERLLADARRPFGRASIADQDSNHDVWTLAAALVCVRIGEHCDKARQGVLDAIDSEAGARWMAVGRNLGSYVIAADLLDLREGGAPGEDAERVQRWMESWMEKHLRDNNTEMMRPIAPFHSGANGAAQEGFVHVAVAAYLRDGRALQRAWDAYRTFVCDPTAPDLERIDLRRPAEDGWTHDPRRPCAINPAGTVKVVATLDGTERVERIDGALVADMRRGGLFQSAPGYTQYPWVGLEGLVPAALILERAGYPAFAVADRAVLRALEYLWYLRTETGDERWFDGERASEIVHLVNVRYGVSFPVVGPTRGGRTVGYTGWTHPASR
jgi:hypothetical protein